MERGGKMADSVSDESVKVSLINARKDMSVIWCYMVLSGVTWYMPMLRCYNYNILIRP